ncbi:hypothetical protein CspHIS471_0511870 [Cutaneotrichosporon sp. HIS471]|nr:hypothetical protein CspHIS471_0511870 [Cutaneotrichosporon sp. HIS471]
MLAHKDPQHKNNMTIDIDAAALRAKYAEERDKRLAAPVGRNSKPLEKPGENIDPHMPVIPREPVTDHVEFCYIGAGFSGLLTAARVKEAGIKSVRIIDKAGGPGGVWYWNRYPGAMCDTAAMVYLPLLEETGHMPTHKYVHGPEIHEHCERIATKYGLYDDALFHTDVTGLVWEEDGKRWRITTDRGDSFTASYVGIGSGPLNVAQLPDIPGIEKFKGKQFHTSRWEYEYTGGDRFGAPLTKLGDKKVGIVGTGATGVQCIPALSRDSGELLVFQRTPSAVDVRNNHPFDPEWFKEISKEPGWHSRWLQSFSDCWGQSVPDPSIMWEDYPDLVDDGWTNLAIRWRNRYRDIPAEQFGLPAIMAAMEEQDNETMERIRARVDEIVTDKDKAAGLKPWFRQLCKRPCFHDEYLPAFNKESTKLVETDGQGVTEVTETGVIANGKHYELDCIVWASGFQFIAGEVLTRFGYDIVGPQGKISDMWAAKGDGGGMRTLHGLQTAGFPNLFFQQLPQTGFLISNLPNNFVPQAANVAALIAHAKENGHTTIDVKPEAQAAWCDAILQHGRPIGNAECTPGYYNNEGKGETIHTKLNAGYPAGASAFAKLMDEWRAPGPQQFAGVAFA